MRVSAFFVFARWLLVLQALLAFPHASAAEPLLQTGDYVTERGWGTLVIKRGNGGALNFKLEAMGANAHSCGLRGEIRNGRATLDGMDKGLFYIPTHAHLIDDMGARHEAVRAATVALGLKPAP